MQIIRNIIYRAPDFFIKKHAHDPTAHSKARTIYWYTVFWTTSYFIFLGLNIYWGTRIGILYYAACFPFICMFWVFLYYRSHVFAGIFISYVATFFLFGLAIFQGGFGSPAITWTFTVVPIASYAFASSSLALQLTIVGLVETIIIYIAEEFKLLPPNSVPKEFQMFNYINGYFFGGVLCFIFMNLIERDRERARRIIDETHRKVLQLKEAQDGDYFLTSLILQPLQGEIKRGEMIKTEIFTRQKKRFKFRHREAEIGGDLCITDNITLMGVPYTFFMNADAMGKSLQGAGGAIVLGAIMNSRLARSADADVREYPEIWLKNSFEDVQTVFETFDGSMLISAVYGLINDLTGRMYFAAVEHPEPVLYRAGQASLLKEEAGVAPLMKFGVAENAGRFHLREFRMLPGDVLVFGSDGRDDLRLEDGTVNSDETNFPKLVREGGGRLDEITRLLSESGALTDDLSLIRVEYPADAPRREGDGKKERRELEQLLKSRNYQGALELAEQLAARGFEGNVMVYYGAYACFKLNRLREALRMTERLAVRDADFKENNELREKIRLRLARQTGELPASKQADGKR